MKTLQIPCVGYSVVADVYDGSKDGPVLLSLIGRTSRRTKQRYYDFLPRLAKELGITSVIFDYSGHGDSPFDLDELRPAQHFLEVITVFDWIKEHYPKCKIFVIGSSYGGFLATQLVKYRQFDALILRAPAMWRPEDFYTRFKEQDDGTTMTFRRDAAALAKHPLLTRAAKFKGNVLLVVHEHDERIPKPVTDAYANAFKPDIIVDKDVTHSLDQANQAQIDAYNQKIFGWLAEQTGKGKNEPH